MSAPGSPSPSSSPADPRVERSLERLRALLLAEGGLIASLVSLSRGGGGGGGGRAGGGSRAEPGGGGSRDVIQNASSGSDGNTRDGDSIARGKADGEHIPAPAQLAAAGPRAKHHREDYELLIESIYEGYLLHYATPRVALTPDGDLALLAGDRLYALGLARLIALGDVAAVAELADTITLAALAQGADAPELAEAVWAAGARAIGWGSGDAHARAKDLALAGAPAAIEAMRTSATGLAAPP